MRVLLLSSEGQDQSFFAGAAQAAGFPLTRVGSPDEYCDEVLKDSAALAVVDMSHLQLFQEFEKTVTEKVGLYSAAINANGIFFVGPPEFHEAGYVAQSELFGHYIPRTFDTENQALIGRVFAVAGQDAGQARQSGLEKYFAAGAKIQNFTVTKSQQKIAIVESLKDNLLQIGFKQRQASVIATATDELIMNAVFDAPMDAQGKQLYAQTLRSTAIDLGPKEQVSFSVGYDGKTLAVAVIDQFGSVDKKKLLGHLSKSYETEEFKVKANVAGAGIGLANVYRNCGGMIFECEMGAKTQVTLFYKKTDSFKDFKDQFRFLSTFMYFS